MKKIGIIGTGAFGTALWQALSADKKAEAVLCGRAFDGAALQDCAAILIVTPAQEVRAALRQLAAQNIADKPLVICAKGIELKTGKLMSHVAAEELPRAPVSILTGPTFAADIAQGLPTAFTLAVADSALASELSALLSTRSLRPYLSDDVIGAQVGGAVKNVIAIGCGIITGRGLGESARAAMMTRGLAEIARLAVSLGGKRETLMGLCGIGDLMLTCSSLQSRNYSLGVELGKGGNLSDILSQRRAVTEGVHTARAIPVLAARQKVDMPLSAIIDRCLNENLSIDAALKELMDRPLRVENI